VTINKGVPMSCQSGVTVLRLRQVVALDEGLASAGILEVANGDELVAGVGDAAENAVGGSGAWGWDLLPP
jgi:hypothetical protein